MKSIIGGKLYDTDKSEKLCDFSSHSIYRTNNGTLFMTYSDQKTTEQISNVNQGKIKDLIGQHFPNDYIEIFGKVEEA